MFSGSSPIFALFNHTTFSLTQIGATFPLTAILLLYRSPGQQLLIPL